MRRQRTSTATGIVTVGQINVQNKETRGKIARVLTLSGEMQCCIIRTALLTEEFI